MVRTVQKKHHQKVNSLETIISLWFHRSVEWKKIDTKNKL